MDSDRRQRLTRALRAGLSVLLLAAILLWVLLSGDLFSRLSVPLIACATAASVVANMLNASVLAEISAIHGGRLAYRQSIYASCLGSFANAAGGLPVGTALKIALLNRQGGLTLGQITHGMAAFTGSIALFLLAYAAIATFWLDVPQPYKAMPLLLLVVGMVALLLLIRIARTMPFVARQIAPLRPPARLTRVALISGATAAAYVSIYWTIANFLYPELSLAHIVFMASIGVLFGQATFLHTVGGIQELSMALSAVLIGIAAIDGVQLGLTMRAASLISSGLILITLHVAATSRR